MEEGSITSGMAVRDAQEDGFWTPHREEVLRNDLWGASFSNFWALSWPTGQINGDGQHVSTRSNEENYKYMARVIVIPQNYEQLPHIERKRIIPICITALDRHGRPIPSEWFSKGVEPVRAHLVNIARHMLGDPWCVSELAEVTVHRLCERHHTVVRPSPARLVLKKAMWVAKEMRNGGWRQMRSHNFNLALDALDEKVRENTLVDPNKYADIFDRQIMLDWFEDRLRIEGRTEIRRVYQLVRRGYSWQEVAQRMGGPDLECVKRRFYRWVKRAARRLSE